MIVRAALSKLTVVVTDGSTIGVTVIGTLACVAMTGTTPFSERRRCEHVAGDRVDGVVGDADRRALGDAIDADDVAGGDSGPRALRAADRPTARVVRRGRGDQGAADEDDIRTLGRTEGDVLLWVREWPSRTIVVCPTARPTLPLPVAGLPPTRIVTLLATMFGASSVACMSVVDFRSPTPERFNKSSAVHFLKLPLKWLISSVDSW